MYAKPTNSKVFWPILVRLRLHLFSTAQPKPSISENDMPEQLVDPECNPANPRKLLFPMILSAAYNIRDVIRHTECRFAERLSQDLNMNVFLKMELNQVTGSFKERGACWALMKAQREGQYEGGIWAASAGNHAYGLAYHGKRLNMPINVVMPLNASIMKVDSSVKFGANVILKGADMKETRQLALKMSFENKGKFINGYDQVDIMAGAGTIGLEILDQVKDLDAVLVPIGGGGLLAGVSIAIKTLYPNVQVIGVESDTCPSFKNALEKGVPTYTETHPTLADGLAVPIVGVNAFHTAKDYVDRVVTVSEQLICVSILRLIEYEKIVVEGSGAIGIGALMSGKMNDLRGKRVATILSGGNIDAVVLGRAVERGLVFDGRLIRFRVVVSDRPGGLGDLLKVVGAVRASVKEISMSRAWIRQDVFSVAVKIVAEVRNRVHANELEKILKEVYKDVAFQFYGEE